MGSQTLSSRESSSGVISSALEITSPEPCGGCDPDSKSLLFRDAAAMHRLQPPDKAGMWPAGEALLENFHQPLGVAA